MREFVSTNRRVHDLKAVLESFSPAEAAKLNGEDALKNLKHVDKLCEELGEACKDFAEKMTKFTTKQQEIAEAARKEVAALPSDDKKDEAVKEIAAKGNAKLAELEKEMDKELGLTEASNLEVKVTIKSDERHKFLKDIMPKLVEKYTQRKALLETVDAVEGAKEV